MAAVPLIGMAWQLNRILAPAIAGFAIAAAGAGLSFFLSAVGAATMIAAIRMLRVGKIPRSNRGSMARSIAEGAQFVWHHSLFRIVIGMAFVNSLFSLGYVLMFPVFAKEEFGVGPRGLSLLFLAAGIGGVIALLSVSNLIRVLGPGRVILGGLGLLNASLIGFAFSPSYEVTLGVLVLVGFAGHMYLVGGEVLIQTQVPDQLRGRVMGLYGLLWSIMPLGAAILNSTPDFVGAPRALAGGASIVLLFVVFVGLRSKVLRSSTLGVSDETAPTVEPSKA